MVHLVASFHSAVIDDLLVPTLALAAAIAAVAAIRPDRPSRTALAGSTVVVAVAFLVPLALSQGWISAKALDAQRRSNHFNAEQARLGCVRGDRIVPGFIPLARRTIPEGARYSITVESVPPLVPVRLCLAQVLLPRRPVARVGAAPWLVLYGVAPAKQRALVRGGRVVPLPGSPTLAIGRLGRRAR